MIICVQAGALLWCDKLDYSHCCGQHPILQSLFFQLGDTKFSAHRIVLAASIPYFQAMFTHDMVEAKQNEITMQGIEAR